MFACFGIYEIYSVQSRSVLLLFSVYQHYPLSEVWFELPECFLLLFMFCQVLSIGLLTQSSLLLLH